MTEQAFDDLIRFCDMRHKPIDDTIKEIRKNLFLIYITLLGVLLTTIAGILVSVNNDHNLSPVPVKITIDRDILTGGDHAN